MVKRHGVTSHSTVQVSNSQYLSLKSYIEGVISSLSVHNIIDFKNASDDVTFASSDVTAADQSDNASNLLQNFFTVLTLSFVTIHSCS